MELQDFRNIARYCNSNWKGSFTKDEVEANANDYYSEYLAAKRTHESDILESLLEGLEEDMKYGEIDDAVVRWIEELHAVLDSENIVAL